MRSAYVLSRHPSVGGAAIFTVSPPSINGQIWQMRGAVTAADSANAAWCSLIRYFLLPKLSPLRYLVTIVNNCSKNFMIFVRVVIK